MNFRHYFLSIALLLASLSSWSQSDPFYRIEYDVVVEPGENDDPSLAAMMQDMVMVLAFQGEKARVEMDMQMMNMTMVYDQQARRSITLMNMMGQRNAQVYEGEEYDAMQGDNEPATTLKIRETGKTKTIAGYTSRQAFLTMPGQDEETEVWYTPDIKVENQSTGYEFQGLPGFPLEMTTRQNGMGMHMTAASVATDGPPKGYFSLEVPEGYVITENP